jgi:hypothetical protein
MRADHLEPRPAAYDVLDRPELGMREYGTFGGEGHDIQIRGAGGQLRLG